MITGAQIRAARSALKWSGEKLAHEAGIGLRTIKRLEQTDGVPDSHSSTLIKLQKTLEGAGIEFIGSPDEGPGIRLHKPAD